MKSILFARVLNTVASLTLIAGAPSADAQSKVDGALRVKSYNAVLLAPLRDANGEQMPFDYFARVAILANGSVLFSDRYEPRIILADSTGRFMAAAGTKGSGPGEFAARSRILRLRGDSIGVHDATLRRLSIFDAKLKFVRTALIPELAPTKGTNAVQGQFANGSIVMMHRPMIHFSAPDGVSDVQHILYVSGRDGTFRQFNLPLSQELQLRARNRRVMFKVPMLSTHGVAVCERGFVTTANGRVEVYDTSFTRLSTPPYRGRVDTVTAAERTEQLQVHTASLDDPAFERRIKETLDAVQPRRVVRYSPPVVSADGILWFSIGKEAEGRYVRTTVRGVIIDTLYAPYQILHVDKRLSVASGPFSEEDDESPIVFVRQKAVTAQRKPVPSSPLGRCNSLVQY